MSRTKAILERLPPEREAQLPAIRDEWIRIGLSTERAGRPAAEAGVDAAYRAAGLEPPRIKVWLDSPLAGTIAAAILGDKRFWATVGDTVGDTVWATVGDTVGDTVWATVWDTVGDTVWATVWDTVGATVRATVGEWRWRAVYGQHEASWLAFYAAFRGLVPEVDRLQGLEQVARSAGWWWPFERAVILTERPTVLARDDRGRLHSPDGPALLYPDGWGIWAWHGVRLDRSIIEQPETITVAAIESQRNAEIRRVMLERYGPARYLIDSGAQLVHSDDFGALYRKEQPDDEPLVMVRVVNATREPDGSFRDYWLRVPPTVRTAREAVAWTFEVPAHEYRPAVQT